MNLRRLMSFILGSLLVTGCTLNVPQLNSLQKAVETPLNNLSEFEWSLVVGDYITSVYAVDTEDGYLFAGYGNDSLLFDGFLIKRIDGLEGFNAPIQFSGSDAGPGRRVYIDATGRQTALKCNQKIAIGAVARQVCTDQQRGRWLFELEFDDTGALIEVRQTIDSLGTVLTLTKR